MGETNETAKKALKLVYQALDDKLAGDVKMLDIQNISILSDYFVIATGNNPNHVKAMADEVAGQMNKNGFTLKHSEGYQTSTWILLDFGLVVVHLFNKDDRAFYNLERIWGDAAVVLPEMLGVKLN